MKRNRPPIQDLLLYYSFVMDAEDKGLAPPSFTQYMTRPDYYEGWLGLALDEPPEWFKKAFEK